MNFKVNKDFNKESQRIKEIRIQNKTLIEIKFLCKNVKNLSQLDRITKTMKWI